MNDRGNLKFQIPAMQAAAYYNFGPLQVGNHLHVPAYGTQRMLNSRLGLDPRMYGKQGFAKIVGGNAVGAALAFGPQAVADARASGSIGEFFERSAYSQSGNAVAFEVGIAVTFILASMGLPISLVIILPFLISSATQSKSMIASHPHSVFNATRYGFLVIAVFFYLPCLYYKWWLTPATILTLLIFIKRGKCIYISDSYTHYCKYFVFQMILMFSLISGAITFATGTEQWNWQTGGLLSLLSLLSALITHHLVSQIKIKPSPYEIRDNRVHFTSRRTTTINAVFWSGISASCAGVLEPLFQEHPRIVLIGSVLFPSIVVLAAWRTLAGLAQLKSEEKRKGVRYTFSNLEEIQAIRARSWAARLFILLNDAISKPR